MDFNVFEVFNRSVRKCGIFFKMIVGDWTQEVVLLYWNIIKCLTAEIVPKDFRILIKHNLAVDCQMIVINII